LCYEENGEEVHPHPECTLTSGTSEVISYRGELLRIITSTAAMTPGHARGFLETALNEHAHELAEKIRADRDLQNDPGQYSVGMNRAAFLIDPEVAK